MGFARIRISEELFLAMLPLPVSARIVGSIQTEEPRCVEVVVEDAALPELRIGEKPQLVLPTYRKNVPVEFVDWGLDKS